MEQIIHPIQQCEIWVLDFDPTIGQEIKKTRPALVVSNSYYNIGSGTVFVIPLTSYQEKFKDSPFHIPLNRYKVTGLKTESSLAMSQFRSVSKLRFKNKIAEVDESILIEIGKRLVSILHIDPENMIEFPL